MGRIRTIKPELRDLLEFAQLTDGAARLFLMLFTLVDDKGRCGASPAYLAGNVFFARPRSLKSIGQLLSELEAAGFIARYTAKGSPWLEIPGWVQKTGERGGHWSQRIDKPQPTTSPVPPWGDSANHSANHSANDSAPDPIRSEGRGAEGDLYLESEGTGKGEGGGGAKLSLTGAAVAACPAGWVPAGTEENRTAARAARERGADLERSLARFRLHASTKRIGAAQMDAHWRIWLADEQAKKGKERRYEILTTFEGREVVAEFVGDAALRAFIDDPGGVYPERRVVELDNGLLREATDDETDAGFEAEVARENAARGVA